MVMTMMVTMMVVVTAEPQPDPVLLLSLGQSCPHPIPWCLAPFQRDRMDRIASMRTPWWQQSSCSLCAAVQRCAMSRLVGLRQAP